MKDNFFLDEVEILNNDGQAEYTFNENENNTVVDNTSTDNVKTGDVSLGGHILLGASALLGLLKNRRKRK